MTATPLNCIRSEFDSPRLRTLHATLGVVVLLAILTSSCAVSGQGADISTAHDLQISSSLPSAVQGSPYNAVLSVSGGLPPYQFSIFGGALPPGLSLNTTTGSISGKPTNAINYSFTVSVTDSKGRSGQKPLLLSVRATTATTAVSVVVSPLTETLSSGGTERFTAGIRGTSDTAVQWTATAGKISSSGLFTAPSVTATQTTTVKATSLADPSAQGTATITITPSSAAPQPQPPLSSSSSSVGSSSADNRYCGAGDQVNFGTNDGPATLPQRCINTALSNTPSRGKRTLVPEGGNANIALENAACGDVILLQAGATFKGPITLPAKNCDAQHWITVRTSASDGSLPVEGTRLTPCYAGVSSLPSRPAYSCSSAHNVLAKIEIATGAGAITVAPEANYYRMIGLEITRRVGTGTVYGLVKTISTADHLIFDRVWIHGTALDETVRGIYLGDSTNVAVIDSYLNDFHCIAQTGACTDAQTINGGNSLLPVGSYKIVNNFLEAAAENVMFGGASGSTVPSDIEIRRNHIFKPLTWMRGRPNFIGKNFVVKNLFEIKNAERLLFEGNVLENSWGGFSQVGWGIVLTPRGNWAADRDITIRYNTISHVGSGFQIAASQHQLVSGQWVDSIANERVSIHDVTVDDMNAVTYDGDGIAFQISSGLVVNRPLNNLTIDHVTMLTDPNHTLLLVGSNYRNPLLPFNIVFTNNVVVAGAYSVWSTGGTYTGTCPKSGQPLATFNQCWSSYTVTNNVIIAYPRGEGSWPTGNLFATSPEAVGFTNYNNGNGGDYQLSSFSPYLAPSPGADVSTINSKIAGVR